MWGKQDSPQDEGAIGITADRSDSVAYQQRSGQQQAPVARSSASVMPLLMLVLVLVLGGALHLSIQQAEQRQQELEARLEQALAARDQQLSEMAVALDSTGESLSETGSSTEKKLRFLDSEMRKLWAVSNQRNKASIKANREGLDKLSAARKSTESKLKAAVQRVSEMKKELAGMRQELEQARTAREERELLLQTRIDQVAAQLSVLSSRLEKTNQQAQKLAASVTELQSMDETIQSFNAFRKQTVQTMTRLQTVVNALQKDMEDIKRVY